MKTMLIIQIPIVDETRRVGPHETPLAQSRIGIQQVHEHIIMKYQYRGRLAASRVLLYEFVQFEDAMLARYHDAPHIMVT